MHVVRRLPADAVWQVIGIGRSNLAMTAIGLAMGGNVRTGMEDTLMLPHMGSRRAPAGCSAVRAVPFAHRQWLMRPRLGEWDQQDHPRSA